MTPTFTDEDLFRWIDEWTLQKSEQCLGGVRNRQLRDGLLTAEVQGSARHPYYVEIDLTASTRTARSRLQSACSCPVGRTCKHVAAVLVVHAGFACHGRREPPDRTGPDATAAS